MNTQGFTPPVKPSGLCFGNEGELSTLDVSGAPAAPSRVTFYSDGTGSGNASAQYMFELFAPGTTKPLFFDSLGLGEPIPQMNRVFPLSPTPTSVNGTWTLCAYVNMSGSPVTIDKWGLFIE